MGFDFSIQLSLCLCPNTGKPFVYKTEGNTLVKDYTFPEIIVPEEHRRFLSLRGHHLHAYTDCFNQDNICDIDVVTFLDAFPSWDEVDENKYYCSEDYDWHEEDHDAFQAALKWFSEQSYTFRASWCY